MQKKSRSKESDLETEASIRGNEACIISKNDHTKENVLMKIALNTISILLFLPGVVFFLQGVNILPGSAMTGDPKWAIIGGVMLLLGAGLFWFANRKK